MIPAPAFFDSPEVRETVLDDAEVYLELMRLCDFDWAAIELSLAYMHESILVWVSNDIREKRERKAR